MNVDGTDGFVLRSGRPLSDVFVAMQRETLRYAVSRAMFCPSCEHVLDVDDAVLYFPTTANHRTRPYVLCGSCSDAMVDTLSAVDHAALLAQCEITDGRVKP